MNTADRHLAVPGARLRYRDEGAGAAVVFVHGWALDLDIWQPQAPLTATMRMVRYDRRGFGLSTGGSSLAADVEDLRTLIDGLEVVNPLLVGMSQGARVVLEFAVRHPAIACGLLLDGAPPLSGTDVPMAGFRQTAARDGLDAFRALWAAHPLTQLVSADQPTRALLARVLANYPGADLLAEHREPPENIDDSVLAQVRLPVLIVNGEHDLESRQRAGAELRIRLARASRVTIAGAGHLPNLDAPSDYNHIVDEFAHRHLPAVA